MRDVNFGWLIRYLHANTASFFFVFVYLHIGRGLYYGSYKSPRIMLWSIGVIIFIVIIATAFLGIESMCLKWLNIEIDGIILASNLLISLKLQSWLNYYEAGVLNSLFTIDIDSFDYTLINSCLIPFVAAKTYPNLEIMKDQILSENKKVAGVYAFQNSETNEILYVGSSINIAKRFNEHFNGEKSNEILQRAFDKSGLSAFRFLILETVNLSEFDTVLSRKQALLEAEQRFFEELNPRYNILKTAGSLLGFKQSDESLAKRSGPNHPLFGTPRSDETRALISTGITGKTNALGVIRSDKTRALLSAANSGANNPNALPIFVYSAETGSYISDYPGIYVASKALSINYRTLKKYLILGLPYRGMIFKSGSV